MPFRCAPDFDANVIVIHVTPGISSDVLMRLLEHHEEKSGSSLDGIVLLPFGVGTVPCLERPIAPFVRRAVDAGIDVLVANASTGKIDLPLYENSQVLLDAGAIPGGEMRVESALVKLMHACATYRDIHERHEYLRWNVAGELE